MSAIQRCSRSFHSFAFRPLSSCIRLLLIQTDSEHRPSFSVTPNCPELTAEHSQLNHRNRAIPQTIILPQHASNYVLLLSNGAFCLVFRSFAFNRLESFHLLSIDRKRPPSSLSLRPSSSFFLLSSSLSSSSSSASCFSSISGFVLAFGYKPLFPVARSSIFTFVSTRLKSSSFDVIPLFRDSPKVHSQFAIYFGFYFNYSFFFISIFVSFAGIF